MPSVTQPERSMVSPSPKKRRRPDGAEAQTQFSHQLQASPNPSASINNNDRLNFPCNRGTSPVNIPGKAVLLPPNKKARQLDDDDTEPLDDPYSCRNIAVPASLLQLQQSNFCHAHPDPIPVASASSQQGLPNVVRTNPSLSPCHVCHRKPTKKSDIDSFADCMGCGDRTCFICLRSCQGWLPVPEDSRSDHAMPEDEDLTLSFTMHDVDDGESTRNYADSHADNHADRIIHLKRMQQRQKKGEGGDTRSWIGHGHREVICSQCCIERGSEGEVVCLGCLAGMKGA
ncbi:hypothetical protein GGR50DRAFT_670895 [Xylaria sp. CBS 124048]|nr:hypothetical protein GGR50DRAFT_670895 [Xylaria sp. CBS 124048]